jgi:hypothetical protein
MRRWILGLVLGLAAFVAAPHAQDIANEVWSNNGTSTLASAIDSDDTSLTVASGDGALFPSPTGSQYMWLTLQEGSNIEIIKCTSRSSDVISGCTRAQQGTSAHSFTTSATVDNALTAGTLESIRDLADITNLTGTLALGHGGTGAALSDPGGDRMLFWDDSAGTMDWLTPGGCLSVSGKSLLTTDCGSGSGGSTVTGVYHAEDYGAKCDDSTDDTDALQSAIDATKATGGTLVLPVGICVVSDTLVVGGGDGSSGDGTSYVSIVGQGPLNTVLSWNGDSSGTLLDFQQNKYFEARGFGVKNGTGTAGTTIGIALEGPGSTGGTSTLIGALRMIQVSGFDLCIKAGAGDASSEILYEHVGFESCGTGWRNFGLNTLDHVFQMVTCGASTLCFQIDSGNAYLDGGSFSNNTTDIEIGRGGFAASNAVTIRNIRSEGAGTFVHGGVGQILIESNMVAGMDDDGDGHAVEIDGGGMWAIVNNRFDGDVHVTNNEEPTLTLINNALKGDETNNLPWTDVTGTTGRNVIVFARTNVRISGTYANRPFQDVSGMTSDPGGEANPPFYRQDWTTYTVDHSFPNFITARHHLNTRSLGESSVADGTNLRVAVKFDGDDTVNFTFKRTLTVTQDSSNTHKITPTSGYATNADIGKVVSYSDGTNTFQQIIRDFDGTSLYVGTNIGFGAGQSGSITIGEDEPDAKYMIAGYACDAPEALGFTNLSTTGFTVTSSNSSSTATCTVLILR